MLVSSRNIILQRPTTSRKFPSPLVVSFSFVGLSREREFSTD